MTQLLTPLFGHLPQLAALLCDAVCETATMLIVSLLVVRHLHVSADVDAFLDKLFARRKAQ